jgi:hypothetical protein
MRRRALEVHGQTAVETAAMLAVVVTIIVAVSTVDVPGDIRKGISDTVCRIDLGRECGSSGVAARSPTRGDRDGDGLSDRKERRLGTARGDADSDGDGITDGDEVRRRLNPRSRDSDKDGIQDAREAQLARSHRLDPRRADTDGDGLLDGAELAAGTPAYDGDLDKDNLGGNPDASGRGDDLTDYEEIFRHGTDPKRTDTDEDGVDDGDEVRAGTNPLVDERSLGTKVGTDLTDFLLDDPSNLSIKGIAKGLGKGLGKLGAKLGIKQGDEAVDDAADAIADARKRRQDAAESTPPTQGKLKIDEGGDFSESERRVAQQLADEGRDVHLRVPTGRGRTSDLVVDGVPWDVYTPQTSNPDRIISAIASKGSQVEGGGVVIDLSQTTVTRDQLGNVLERVRGTGARVSDVRVIE